MSGVLTQPGPNAVLNRLSLDNLPRCANSARSLAAEISGVPTAKHCNWADTNCEGLGLRPHPRRGETSLLNMLARVAGLIARVQRTISSTDVNLHAGAGEKDQCKGMRSGRLLSSLVLDLAALQRRRRWHAPPSTQC